MYSFHFTTLAYSGSIYATMDDPVNSANAMDNVQSLDIEMSQTTAVQRAVCPNVQSGSTKRKIIRGQSSWFTKT